MNQRSSQIREVLNRFENQPLANDIWQILDSQQFAGYLSAQTLNTLTERYQLNAKSLALLFLPVAACYATTPISHFNVGAIALDKQGNAYFGANQEFAQSNIQQSIHAEQSAISHAWMRGATQLTDIIINYTPCGHCRQFMNELNSAATLQIHLPHAQNNSLQQYLPDSFGPRDLQIETCLLDKTNNQLQLTSDDHLVQQALAMANQAHAPYSQSYSGVALELQNGQIFGGSYAENAAFNPSLPAMQVVLNYLILSGQSVENIKRAVMVERPTKLSGHALAKELLGVISPVPLEYHSI